MRPAMRQKRRREEFVIQGKFAEMQSAKPPARRAKRVQRIAARARPAAMDPATGTRGAKRAPWIVGRAPPAAMERATGPKRARPALETAAPAQRPDIYRSSRERLASVWR